MHRFQFRIECEGMFESFNGLRKQKEQKFLKIARYKENLTIDGYEKN